MPPNRWLATRVKNVYKNDPAIVGMRGDIYPAIFVRINSKDEEFAGLDLDVDLEGFAQGLPQPHRVVGPMDGALGLAHRLGRGRRELARHLHRRLELFLVTT